MTETRPDWTISRQRAWGVPIPAVRCAECDEVAPLTVTMDRVEEIFAREGSDAWYSRPAADFVAHGVKCAKCGGTVFVKEEDILDVWFDSGSSQAAVLAMRPELKWPADAYLEAVEQARGWFSSSLFCAVRGSRRRAVQEHHQSRADDRRQGPQDVQVARQLGGRRRCGRPDGRRRAAAGVRLARLHRRHHARPDDFHRGVGVVSQDSQHLPLRARQSRRLRSGARRGRIEGHARVRSLHPRAHREAQERSAPRLRSVRVPDRVPGDAEFYRRRSELARI